MNSGRSRPPWLNILIGKINNAICCWSETLRAAMLDMVRDAMVAMDATGLIVEVNAAAERIFGYDRAHAVGRRRADLIIPAELRHRHRIGMARFLEGRDSCHWQDDRSSGDAG